MTDPLITKYLPVIRGHIINRYAWLEHRGNCLVTVDDLMQVAAIQLIKLTAEWDQILAERGEVRGEKDQGGLFWSILVNWVKHALLAYYDGPGRAGREEFRNISFDEDPEDAANNDAEVKTSLLQRGNGVHWPSVHRDIVAFYESFDLRAKTVLALRFYDNLTKKQLKDILGTGSADYFISEATMRWRDFARNQFTDHAVDIPPRHAHRWEPPETVHEYIRARHQLDIDQYLQLFTLSLQADPGYLPAILNEERFTIPGSISRVVSPYMQAQIDRLRGEGLTASEIADVLGLNVNTVKYRISTRRAALFAHI